MAIKRAIIADDEINQVERISGTARDLSALGDALVKHGDLRRLIEII